MAKGQRDPGKERFWRNLFRLWRRQQRGGATVREFCAEHGLSEPAFYAWRRIIAKRDHEAVHPQRPASTRAVRQTVDNDRDDDPAFVPLTVTPTLTATLEIVVGQGRVVRVPTGFDAQTLQQLLAVLEGPSC